MPDGDDAATDEFWGPTRFEIGQPWPWEPEWVEDRGFRWLPDTSILLIVEENITQEMCDAVAGPADLALLGSGPLVGILARFGEMWGWMESLVWRRPGQGIPDCLTDTGEATPHLLFKVVLVDVKSKEIRHMRAFTASAHFTKMLYREAADRWTHGTTIEGAQEAFAVFEQRYPNDKATLQGSLARCHGGD